MKITVNTEILDKEGLSLGEFLIMLLGHLNVSYEQCYRKLVNSGLVEPNLFDTMSVILSDNSKNLIVKILMESDDRAIKSNLNFDELARKLQELYPEGHKPGTSYLWRGKTEEIAQKLRTLVVKYDFLFTEEEAIGAVREYANSFKQSGLKYMQLLKFFILKTSDDGQGHREMDSLFMTIIENRRESTI